LVFEACSQVLEQRELTMEDPDQVFTNSQDFWDGPSPTGMDSPN
jgi:hypothetical protein